MLASSRPVLPRAPAAPRDELSHPPVILVAWKSSWSSSNRPSAPGSSTSARARWAGAGSSRPARRSADPAGRRPDPMVRGRSPRGPRGAASVLLAVALVLVGCGRAASDPGAKGPETGPGGGPALPAGLDTTVERVV